VLRAGYSAASDRALARIGAKHIYSQPYKAPVSEWLLENFVNFFANTISELQNSENRDNLLVLRWLGQY
jgi:hypothetical protein